MKSSVGADYLTNRFRNDVSVRMVEGMREREKTAGLKYHTWIRRKIGAGEWVSFPKPSLYEHAS